VEDIMTYWDLLKQLSLYLLYNYYYFIIIMETQKTTTIQLLLTECRDHAITKDNLEKMEKERDRYKEQAFAWYDAYEKLLTTIGNHIP